MSNQKIKQALIKKTKEIIEKANTIYQNHRIDFDNIEIRCTLRGTTAGRALYAGSQRMTLWYHVEMAKKDFEDYVYQTVYHEIAHLYTRKMYPRAKPHGIEFKQVCKAIGGNGRRTHTLNTEGLGQKRVVRRYVYICPKCGQEYELTSHRHKKQVETCFQKNVGYFCRKCVQRLSFTDTLKEYDNISGEQVVTTG